MLTLLVLPRDVRVANQDIYLAKPNAFILVCVCISFYLHVLLQSWTNAAAEFTNIDDTKHCMYQSIVSNVDRCHVRGIIIAADFTSLAVVICE